MTHLKQVFTLNKLKFGLPFVYRIKFVVWTQLLEISRVVWASKDGIIFLKVKNMSQVPQWFKQQGWINYSKQHPLNDVPFIYKVEDGAHNLYVIDK